MRVAYAHATEMIRIATKRDIEVMLQEASAEEDRAPNESLIPVCAYDAINGDTVLFRDIDGFYSGDYIENIIFLLSHEVVHKALHLNVGTYPCRKLDYIDSVIDPLWHPRQR